ncbi:MAG: class I SAM-dependent methyltransferase [Candidatus Vogelbacteria bacterium]|nr:class I SAM-dependent methyltransferase [Candidatus Vogelbacteria bacterium]
MRSLRRKGNKFWNKEYSKAGPASAGAYSGKHLAISTNPSEDLIHFIKWLKRNHPEAQLDPKSSVLDLGCGNGRNLIYLAKTYGIHGLGYDISSEAITQAKAQSKNLNLKYEVRSIAGQITMPGESQALVLDMMTSHFLNEAERANLIKEILRILKPGGWLYFKTFFKDQDINANRLLRENPAGEKGSYIHPKIGVAEHVFTEQEIKDMLGENFIIHKMLRSHRHIEHGHGGTIHAGKRRSISVYAEKR